jgi:hypothetical protein
VWIANDANAEWTEGGNRRPPSIDTYLGWIAQAWKEFPKETIAESFKGGRRLIVLSFRPLLLMSWS